MVKLTLISPKGNYGVRFFPSSGYLGLTPLKFEGVVRTEIEQDGKHLLAKDITVFVRCYEFRQGRLGTIQNNILAETSVTLWRKPECQDWAEIGNSEYPFRLSMPSHATGPSSALYFQEYRICWRIEAVLNHAPIPGVGSRLLKHYDLHLIRHDLPGMMSPPSPVTPISYMSSLSSKSRGPSLRYRISLPTKPVGPLDIVPLQVTVQPLDPTVSVRSATAVVERRIQFSEHPISPPSTSSAPLSSSYSYSMSNQESRLHDRHFVAVNSGDITSATSSSNDLHCPSSSSSVISDNDAQPLLPRHQSSVPNASPLNNASERTATHIFAHIESSHRFTRDSTGTWRQTLNFSWPDTRPSSRWTIGETLQTGMASVRFFIRVKLIVSSPNSSAETVELDDQEIIIVSTNETQRQLALARYVAGRSKSRSPKRSKRDHLDIQLPSPHRSPRLSSVAEVPATTAITPKGHHELEQSHGHAHKFSSASSPHSGSKSSKVKSARRPHTSAGPRDKLHPYDSRGHELLHSHNSRVPVPMRAGTAYHNGPSTNGHLSRSAINQSWDETPRPSTNVSSEGTHTECGLLMEKVGQVEMRAWEEELARIELASQRSTADMMGVVSQRRKMNGHQDVRTYSHAKG